MSLVKDAFVDESFHSSSEANAPRSKSRDDKLYNSYNTNSVYERIDLGNYPNQEQFASHLSTSSPQNSSFVPQTTPQSYCDPIHQEIFVKTEKLQNQFNKVTRLEADCSSNTASELLINNSGYQQFSNHSNGSPIISNNISGSPSGSSEVSEISRPCSVSNLSLGTHNNYDLPQTNRHYSPLSYQQNRYKPYGLSPHTTPQATNFTFISHQNSQEAHNSQTNFHQNFGYNQPSQW